MNTVETRPTNIVAAKATSVATRSVLPETIVFVVLCSLDLVSTVVLLVRHQAIEANPIMAFILSTYGLQGFIIVKSMMLAVPLAGAEAARTRHPQFVRNALRVGIALYCGIYVVGSLHLNG